MVCKIDRASAPVNCARRPHSLNPGGSVPAPPTSTRSRRGRGAVEIKGYRREDAKEKKAAMDTCWVPGVNNLRTLGRWGFAELTEIYQIDADFRAKVERAFNEMIERAGGASAEVSA
jgi:hypothetical protein